MDRVFEQEQRYYTCNNVRMNFWTLNRVYFLIFLLTKVKLECGQIMWFLYNLNKLDFDRLKGATVANPMLNLKLLDRPSLLTISSVAGHACRPKF